jgi:hypothetical protein
MTKLMFGSVMVVWLGAGQVFAQTDAASCSAREVALNCSGGACELVVEIVGKPGCRLRMDEAWLEAQGQPRITEDTSLRIRIVGANLLRYGLKFETREKVVESYVDLEKLWREVLQFVPSARVAAARGTNTFIAAIDQWRRKLTTEENLLAEFVERFKRETVTCGDREEIAQKAESVPATLEDLEALRQAAADLLASTEDLGSFAVYDATVALHEATVNRIRAFHSRAHATAYGVVEPITFSGSGRIVTSTITMTELSSGRDAGVTEVVEFFVHSTLPVMFHAGYAYSALDAFEFEPVAALAGEDLFAQINEAKNTSGFAAFLSYRLGGGEKKRWGSDWFATIGTDFNEPGKRLFLGASGRLKKVLISGGIATASVREADADDRVTTVVDAVGGALGTRELFTRIHTTRQWRPFFSVSFAPF